MVSSTVYQQDAYLLLSDGTRWPMAGPVSIKNDVERVYSNTSVRPDERWEQTDSHGHLHRYVRDEEGVPRLPSLEPRKRHIDCDGSCYSITHGDCDGYDVTVWLCRECGDEVEPGFVHDYEAEHHGIPVASEQHYTLIVAPTAAVPRDPIQDAVYVAEVNGQQHRQPMPPLFPGDMEAEVDSEGTRIRLKLHGSEWKSIKRKPTGP